MSSLAAKAYAKEYYKINKEYYHERNKTYYMLNRNAVLEKNKLWFEQNREKLAAYQRDRRKRNKTEGVKPVREAKTKAKKGIVEPFHIIEQTKTIIF
jgi:hypothetical protein